MQHQATKNVYTGIGLAVLAVIIWSGNFIVARLVIHNVPPISLAFYRWAMATLLLLPFAIRYFNKEMKIISRNWLYFLGTAFSGIALFNTFVYVGAHYTTATNLALIGTTSSPIMSIILARFFLKERIEPQKFWGMLVCITGVLFLLCKGNFKNLLHLHFDTGDLWVLAGALCFAIYNVMARKKPSGVSPINFLFIIFLIGTLMLLPFFLYERSNHLAIIWDREIIFSIIYLGIGASVICFLIWNIAISRLGAGRTALFGNLIPIFSSLEATFLLQERFTTAHLISMLIVFSGIIIANFSLFRKA
jgi:drug/metabolite transporter (DMT)-like permease